MRPWLFGSIVATAAAWIGWFALFLRRGDLPEKVPIHWNIEMRPDGWASGPASVWWLALMPGFGTVLLALMAALPRLSPEPFRDAGTLRRFDFAMFAATVFFLIVGVLVYVAMRTGEFPATLFLAAMFGFFAVMGWSMRGIRPNPWMGVRLPWTMNDEVVWNRTHEFTAWLWVGAGIVGAVAAAIGAPPKACLIGIVVVALTPIAASFVIARRYGGTAPRGR